MPWMTVDEAARVTRVSRRHMYALARRRQVPVLRLGRVVRVWVPATPAEQAHEHQAGGQQVAERSKEP